MYNGNCFVDEKNKNSNKNYKIAINEEKIMEEIAKKLNDDRPKNVGYLYLGGQDEYKN